MTAQKKVLAALIGGLFVGTMLTACGGGGGSSTASPTPTSMPTDAPTQAPLQSLSGFGVDGYIAGATVFLDQNNNGQLDGGEFSTTTNAAGGYTLSHNLLQSQLSSSQLVLIGGNDLGTGKPFVGTLFALPSADAAVSHITPLSSLVRALVAADPNNTPAQAVQKLSSVLGINSANLLADPMIAVAQEPAVLQKAVAMQKAIEILAAAEAKNSGNLVAATAKVTMLMAQTIASNASVVRPDALPSISALVQQMVSDAAQGLGSVRLDNLASVQAVSQVAADMAKATELVIAAGVANMMSAGVLNRVNITDSEIVSAVQQHVSTGVAGLADLQNIVISAAGTVASTPLALNTLIATNASALGSKAISLNQLMVNAQATPIVPVITTANAASQAQALSAFQALVSQVAVELPGTQLTPIVTAAPTQAPVYEDVYVAPTAAPTAAPTEASTESPGGTIGDSNVGDNPF